MSRNCWVQKIISSLLGNYTLTIVHTENDYHYTAYYRGLDFTFYENHLMFYITVTTHYSELHSWQRKSFEINELTFTDTAWSGFEIVLAFLRLMTLDILSNTLVFKGRGATPIGFLHKISARAPTRIVS